MFVAVAYALLDVVPLVVSLPIDSFRTIKGATVNHHFGSRSL